jgi:L-lactate dehydrogenase complex protein LldF
MVRRKRDAAAASTPNWEELREQASLIKEETIAQLPAYIRQFAEAAKQNGAIVMEAANDVLMCGYIATLLRVNGVKRVVKSKSMLTEECGLNQYLAIQGLEVTDTDLGECIMQLRKEPPSHIVLPAIHLRKEEIGKTFHRNLGSQKGASDPDYLTEVARKYLRQKFLTADAAITGVNFAVAETGTVVVCTNEGNADMGIHAAPLQIHCVGIDKVIPRMTDLGVFTRLLARSATGQAITSYTSHYNKPKPGGKMYVIIVDNGRNKLSHNHAYRNALKCIRCGACINTCPVYRRSGGHSYGSLIPGPIGSVLAPLRNPAASADLPFACSLCGSCANVCPVKVSLHENLYNLRQELNSQGSTPLIRRAALKVAAWGLSNNALYRTGGAIGRLVLRYFPAILYIPLRSWTKGRKLPVPPRQTFQQWYSKHESRKKI